MKNFDSRVYSVDDFSQWHSLGQLKFNPFFQRRSVWTLSAKSYLMDTIIRGKPMPKVFIRQIIDSATRKSVREIVDGQQRLRTIIGFLNDEFIISKRHNKTYGGKKFSELATLDPDIQTQILNYEISTDLLVNMSDIDVLDVFSRLNSYAIVLNEQERLNAEFFGPFKLISKDLGMKYTGFWIDNRIISESEILRMAEVSLASDLIIAMTDGIQAKRQIKSYYTKYEREFNHDTDDIEVRFDRIMQYIQDLFSDSSLSKTEYRRIHIFYSLYTSMYHLMYGLPNFDFNTSKIDIDERYIILQALEEIELIFSAEDENNLTHDEREFLQQSRRATTDKSVREKRTKYILERINRKFE